MTAHKPWTLMHLVAPGERGGRPNRSTLTQGLLRGRRWLQWMIARGAIGVWGELLSFKVYSASLQIVSHQIWRFISLRRYRKRKAEEEDDDEEGSRLDIFSDEEEEEPSSDSEEEEGINSERVKPPIHNRSTWYHLGRVRLDENPTIEQLIQMNNIENAFVSGDGDKLYCLHSYYWTRSCTFTLSWHASGALAAAQKSLVAEQDQHSISLEHIFHRDSIISQVPYRKFHCLQLFCNSICICFVLTHAPRFISYPRRGYDAMLRLFCRRHSKAYFPWVIQDRQFQPAPIALATKQNIPRPRAKQELGIIRIIQLLSLCSRLDFLDEICGWQWNSFFAEHFTYKHPVWIHC